MKKSIDPTKLEKSPKPPTVVPSEKKPPKFPVPGSPEAIAVSQKIGQEFVDALNKNVLKGL